MRPRRWVSEIGRDLERDMVPIGRLLYPEAVGEAPRTRAECLDGPRPCPWARCRYHLGVEVVRSESRDTERVLRLAEHERAEPSCALDVTEARPDGLTLDEVGRLYGITRERIRQIERKAMDRLGEQYPDLREALEGLAEIRDSHDPVPLGPGSKRDKEGARRKRWAPQ